MILEGIKSKFKYPVFSRDGIWIVPLRMQSIFIAFICEQGNSYLQVLCDTIPQVHSLPKGVISRIERTSIRIEFIRELDSLAQPLGVTH